MARTFAERLTVLADALDPTGRAGAPALDRVVGALDGAPNDRVWLTWAVLNAALPNREDVIGLRRLIARRGVRSALAAMRRRIRDRRGRAVRVVTGDLVVDVHHTARTELATGIQRVVRMTIRRWEESSGVLVGWTPDFTALRALSRAEAENARFGSGVPTGSVAAAEIVIPWRCRYFLPELAIEGQRTSRLSAMAEFSGNRCSVIGFDCVPVTSGETIGLGMGAAFSRNLSAVAHFDQVLAISEAAQTEYLGWRRMLVSVGLTGPEVEAVALPVEAEQPDAAALEEARRLLVVDDLPLLLCVGSHEPRKNHTAVLHAAEVLWREGREFCLAFIGGNAWGGESFTIQFEELAERGRPLVKGRGISDDVLWAAYRVARATVFPSLNEGFGLPVAESLASGTPVVTSDFGSMREIAAGGGAVLVDPRNDDALVAGLRTALFDEEARAELVASMAARVDKTWDDYSAQILDLVRSTPAPAREH